MAKLRRKLTDKARIRTDKRLSKMESEIGRIYATYPALIAIEKEYKAYMKFVQRETLADYKKYLSEDQDDKKAELKSIYTSKVDRLTRKSKKYNAIVRKFVAVLSEVNQKAIDVVNAQMTEVYVDNYNQVAEDCKQVGIKVNG